jgi:hypothetical protein
MYNEMLTSFVRSQKLTITVVLAALGVIKGLSTFAPLFFGSFYLVTPTLTFNLSL